MTGGGATSVRGIGRTAAKALAALAALASLAAPALAEAFPAGSDGRIVFEREIAPSFDTDLFIVNADGSGLANITNSATVDENTASFSPDGRRIIFTRNDGAQDDIWTIKADGSDPVNLTATATVNEITAAYSPDGRSFAYSQCDAGFTFCKLFSRTLSGTPVELSSPPMGLYDLEPQYSPDGLRLVFRRDAPIQREIFVMNVDGSSPLNITNTPNPGGSESRPKFTPDGKRILFDFFLGSRTLLGSMAPDGSGRIPLTSGSLPDELEVWPSGDGRRLTFAQCPAECHIAVADASAQGPVPITAPAAGINDRAPAWETVQRCGKRRATIVGDDGPDKIKGTKKKDVIVANGGKDKISGRGGNDRICGGRGKDRINGGGGNDKCIGGKGKDRGSCEKGKL